MEKIEDPELSRAILSHLAELYKLKEVRQGIHLSTLIYCLTKGFFDYVAPIEPTDEEVMLFSLGLGLQDVLTPTQAEAPIYEENGITFSPDFVLKLSEPARYVELKTTRMSSSREDLPETWLEYIKGGCYMRRINQYELSVLFMLGNYKPPFPQIKSFKLVFTQEELEENWTYLLGRLLVYQQALRINRPPAPFEHCKDWECKNCRYKLQCEALRIMAEPQLESI